MAYIERFGLWTYLPNPFGALGQAVHLHLLVGTNQPVHWLLGGKGLGIRQRTSAWVGSPKSPSCPLSLLHVQLSSSSAPSPMSPAPFPSSFAPSPCTSSYSRHQAHNRVWFLSPWTHRVHPTKSQGMQAR